MRFSNVVAYCKGFYKPRDGGVPEMWKDLSHCIQVDGYMCFTKNDVVQYCLNTLENFAKEFPKEAWKVSFGCFYRQMKHNEEIAKISSMHNPHEANISNDDLLIWTFRDFIKYDTEESMFTEGVIPDKRVLPMIEKECVSEKLWESIINKYELQDFSEWYIESYEERENKIKVC